eukprot:2044447-Pyramimonas_sp.AAC.1
MSASNGDGTDPAVCGTARISGTSMATPLVAGSVALLRQYFTDGFYPTGAAVASDSFEPSGMLLRAVVLNLSLIHI